MVVVRWTSLLVPHASREGSSNVARSHPERFLCKWLNRTRLRLGTDNVGPGCILCRRYTRRLPCDVIITSPFCPGPASMWRPDREAAG